MGARESQLDSVLHSHRSNYQNQFTYPSDQQCYEDKENVSNSKGNPYSRLESLVYANAPAPRKPVEAVHSLDVINFHAGDSLSVNKTYKSNENWKLWESDGNKNYANTTLVPRRTPTEPKRVPETAKKIENIFHELVEDSKEVEFSSSSDSMISANTVFRRFRDKNKRASKIKSKILQSISTTELSSTSSTPIPLVQQTTEMKRSIRVLKRSKTVKPIPAERRKKNENMKPIISQELPPANWYTSPPPVYEEETEEIPLIEEPKLSTICPRLGFETSSNGDIVFTAFLRQTGDDVYEWEKLRKRCERPLKGLQRTFNCEIKLFDDPITHRAALVRLVQIRGNGYRDVLRCKNALPIYFSKLLITSHDTSEDLLNCQPRRRF